MVYKDLKHSIAKLLQERKIAPTQTNISLVMNAYCERFSTFNIKFLDDCITEIFGTHGQIRRNGSKSVTFFNINPTGLFLPHEKSDEKKHFLKKVIEDSILNSLLNPRQMRNVVLALKPHFIQSGSVTIKENDIGTEMYAIESGSFEIIKHNKVIETKTRGMIFGEIALLHNVKRTATVKCKDEGLVWVLNLEEFTAIKSTHEMNMYRILMEVIRDNKIFKSEVYKKNAKEKKVFLNCGDAVDSNFYLVAVCNGKLNVNDTICEVRVGDVVECGIVVDEIEGYYIPKR